MPSKATKPILPVSRPFPLNEFQKAAFRSYGGGDYRHLIDIEDEKQFTAAFAEIDDTLFKYIVIDLGDATNCESLEMAQDRLLSAKDELDNVLNALDAIAAPAPGR